MSVSSEISWRDTKSSLALGRNNSRLTLERSRKNRYYTDINTLNVHLVSDIVITNGAANLLAPMKFIVNDANFFSHMELLVKVASSKYD